MDSSKFSRLALFIILIFLCSFNASAKGVGHYPAYHKSTISKPHSYKVKSKPSAYTKKSSATLNTNATVYKTSSKQVCTTCPRDGKGKIKRNPNAKKQFMKQTGYPHGRPGYVVDHVVPLKKGGTDSPSNMQWQTIEEAKAKDKVE